MHDKGEEQGLRRQGKSNGQHLLNARYAQIVCQGKSMQFNLGARNHARLFAWR